MTSYGASAGWLSPVRTTLKQSELAHRWGTFLERRVESLRLAPQLPPDLLAQWRLSTKYQTLFRVDFGDSAERINLGGAERIYALYRPGGESVVAAAMFERSAPVLPNNQLLIHDLALFGQPEPDRPLHPVSSLGAVLLLEHLHGLKHAEGRFSNLWLSGSTGLRDSDILGLGFYWRPPNGLPAAFVRRDPVVAVRDVHPIRRSLRRVAERLR